MDVEQTRPLIETPIAGPNNCKLRHGPGASTPRWACPNTAIPELNVFTRQIVAPSNAAFARIPFTVLNGVWNPNNDSIVTPLLEYHVLLGALELKSIPAGPAVIARSLLTNKSWTNVTAGQNVVIHKEGGAGNIIFTSSEATRSALVQAVRIYPTYALVHSSFISC